MKIISIKNYSKHDFIPLTKVIDILRMRGYKWKHLQFEENELKMIKDDGTIELFRIERSYNV